MAIESLQFKHRTFDLKRPLIMGILNVTPDSFSDGGSYQTIDKALFQVEKMIKEGADIIDVGGESTRPSADPVSKGRELTRVIPVVKAISERFDTVISLDTSTPEVMHEGVHAGAQMINDIRSLERSGALKMAASLDVPVCIMHMQGTPQDMQQNPHYEDCVAEVEDFLIKKAQLCEMAGIKPEHILIDPGFGFGKTVQDNYQLLKNLPRLCALPYLVLTGLSRKSMIGAVTGIETPSERVLPSAVGALLCAMQGAKILRVHDVKETVQALSVYYAMQEA